MDSPLHALPLDAPAAPRRVRAAPARIAFVDTAKALGLLMVVAGHVPGAPQAVVTAIYSVHMPLFFLISGLLLSTERARASWRATLQRGLRTLLVPYLFFFLLSLAYWLATRDLGERARKFAGVEAASAWQGLASGLSVELFVNATLWFFPCLFVCQLIYAALRRVASAASAFFAFSGLALLLLAFTLPWQSRLPWGLDVAWIALPFYAAGHALRQADLGRGSLAALGLCAAAWLALVALQGRVDLAWANFGAVPLLYLPCAFAGIACVLGLARRLPATAAARWLADNSLVVFPLHVLLINALSGAAQMAGLRELLARHPLAWWTIATAWGLLACVPLAALLRRHAPALIGLRAEARP